MKGAMKGAW